MKVIVGKDIRIIDFDKDIDAFFKNMLTFSNPEYFKKVNMGKWVGNTPKELTMIQKKGNELIVPFGMLPYIFKMSDRFESIENRVDVGESKKYISRITPYDYQEEAIEKALSARQGVIVAPCGSGKTQIGLEIAQRLGLKTLWLTHTHDLLKQSMERALNNFEGLEKDDFGTITNGKIDIGKIFTFATVQTMVNINLEDFRDYWDVIIVDECHHIAGTPTKIMMFYKVLSSLSARYKFGLTATPKRSDGLTGCMFAVLGSKICEIDKERIKNTTCPVNVVIKETEYAPDIDEITMPDGTLSYSMLINGIIRNDERNELIVNDIVDANGTCLVLTDRIEHIECLKRKLISRGVNVLSLSAINSSKGKEEREKAISMLKSGDVKVLIATFALAKEGLDVPSLENVFFTTPQKNEIIITQSAGRVARKSDGKAFGTVYDYVDNMGFLKKWQKDRLKIYKKLEFSIV